MKCTRVGLKVISARVQARLTELDVGPAAGEDSDFSNAGHSLGERKRERERERKKERKKEQRDEEWNLSGLEPGQHREPRTKRPRPRRRC